MIKIKNDRQYNVTKGQLAKLQNALEVADADRDQMDPRVHRAMVAGIRSHIEELEEQLRVYERLKKGVPTLPIKSFADLPRLLTAARIARGLTQRDLANRLGIKPQQVQKYEKTEYHSASLRRILEVIDVLDLAVDTDVRLSAEVETPEDDCDSRSLPQRGAHPDIALASRRTHATFVTAPFILKVETGIDLECTYREAAPREVVSAAGSVI